MTRGRTRYHHGDLRQALIETAIELIGERGVREFSMAEASRRLSVSVSAPYAHFADRDELLAAVAVHAYGVFAAELDAALGRSRKPQNRLAAIAGAYVRFAAAHRPLFRMLFEAGLDKRRHPELVEAERPIEETFLGCVRAICADGTGTAELATAVEAAAHGHAILLLDGSFGDGAAAVDRAAKGAARATLALVDGRRLLSRSRRRARVDSACPPS